MMIIRGVLLETSLAQLQRNTKNFKPASTKRQYAVDPIQVTQLMFTPAKDSITIKGHATGDGKQYNIVIALRGVHYSTSDATDNVTFKATDGNEYHVAPIKLEDTVARVTCNCLDFRWRFAEWNAADKSLYGRKPKAHVSKSNRKSGNPQGKPGVCKHIMKVIIAAKSTGIISQT